MNDYFLLMEYLMNLGILLSHVTIYGYLELKWDAGWAITIILALYLVYQRGKSFPTFIAIAGFLSHSYRLPKLGSIFFLMLEMVYFFGSTPHDVENDEIKFKPYEKEIRQYLLLKDPSLLYKVDSLLEKYTGREDELMRKLRTKYEITSQTAPVQKPTPKPQPTEEPTRVSPVPEMSSTKWGPFDTALSPQPTSTKTVNAHDQAQASPFSIPPTQSSGFSFFSPQPRTSQVNEPRRFSAGSTGRGSGLYGAIELHEDDEDQLPLSTFRRHSTSSNNTSAYRHSQPSFYSQQIHESPVNSQTIFHAQTNEVDEAKRKARAAQLHRINQRLHHR